MLEQLVGQAKRAGDASLQIAGLTVLWSFHRWRNGPRSASDRERGRYFSSEHGRLLREYEDRKRREGEEEASKWYVGELQKLFEVMDAMRALETRRGLIRTVRRLKQEDEGT